MRAAAHAARASESAKAAMEQAIVEATTAVLCTLEAPRDAAVMARARDAVDVLVDVMGALDDERGRSLRVRERGTALRYRAVELIEQARGRPKGRV